MKIAYVFDEDECGVTPISLANAILKDSFANDIENVEALAEHLMVETRRYRREEERKHYQGEVKASVALL